LSYTRNLFYLSINSLKLCVDSSSSSCIDNCFNKS